MDTGSSEIPFSFLFPEELLAKITNPSWCIPYDQIPKVSFVPQVDSTYSPLLMKYLISTVMFAYHNHCHKNSQTYPDDIESPVNLFCHEDLNVLAESDPIGYIGTIKPQNKEDKTKRVLIVFRGTEKISEWLENFEVSQTEVTFVNTKEYVKIHEGFWNAFAKKRYATLSEAIKNTKWVGFWKTLKKIFHYGKSSLQGQLDDLIPKYIKRDFPEQIVELYIAGHSLGAALATIVTTDSILRYQNVPKGSPTIDNVVSYIIGSPRVGSRSLSGLVRRLSQDCKYNFTIMRLVNSEDTVTMSPPPDAGDLVYTQLFTSAPDDCNTISSIEFSDNLGKIIYNHSPFLYFYANEQLLTNKKSAKSIKGIGQKTGDDKKSP